MIDTLLPYLGYTGDNVSTSATTSYTALVRTLSALYWNYVRLLDLTLSMFSESVRSLVGEYPANDKAAAAFAQKYPGYLKKDNQ
jgi:hypothetical protein